MKMTILQWAEDNCSDLILHEFYEWVGQNYALDEHSLLDEEECIDIFAEYGRQKGY